MKPSHAKPGQADSASQAEPNEAKPRPQAKRKEKRWKEARKDGRKKRIKVPDNAQRSQAKCSQIEPKGMRQNQAHMQGTEQRKKVLAQSVSG